MIFVLSPMGHGSRLVTKSFFAVSGKRKDGRCMSSMGRGKKTFPRPRSQIRGLNAGSKAWLDVPPSITYVAYIWQGRMRVDLGVKFDRLPSMWHEAPIGRGIFKGGGFYRKFLPNYRRSCGPFL